MLKKALMTGMAVAVVAAGAVALQSTAAQAGNLSVQLHFGSPGYHAGPRHGRHWYPRDRYGYHGYRKRCYTDYQPLTIRNPLYGVQTVWEPVRVCRW